MTHIKLYTDGACRGNGTANTVAGAGAVKIDLFGNIVEEYRKYLGRDATNNIAEYESLIMGLEGCIGYEKVSIYMDSNLVCKQVKGDYKVKNEKLKVLHKQVMNLLENFTWDITYIPREQNKIADKLANQAIDNAISPRVIIPEGIQVWIYRKGISEPYVCKFNQIVEAIDFVSKKMKEDINNILDRGLTMNSRYMVTNENQEIIFDKKLVLYNNRKMINVT